MGQTDAQPVSGGIVRVQPHIVTPPCVLSGEPQDCRQCALSDGTGCASPKSWCIRPYKRHRHGCPNFGTRATCPPHAPMFDDVFDVGLPVYAVFARFDLAAQVARMAEKHPDWTLRQKRSSLYWQNTVRKLLREEIHRNHETLSGLWYTLCPEAMGVDVTETLRDVGVRLEWPPESIVCKAAFVGTLRSEAYKGLLNLA